MQVHVGLFYTASAGEKKKMDIDKLQKLKSVNIFDVIWSTPAPTPLWVILLILTIIIAVFVFARLFSYVQSKQAKRHQLFLFKAKHLGLTNFQVKLVMGMANIIKLKEHELILKDSYYYELSIGNFLKYLQSKKESNESNMKIGKDIISIHSKLFLPSKERSPIDSLDKLEKGYLFYLVMENGEIFIGKFLNISDNSITLRLFRSAKDLRTLSPDANMTAYLWRTGDAEYIIDSKILSFKNNLLTITKPEALKRGKEMPHPLAGVNIPCVFHGFHLTETINENKEVKNSTETPSEYSGIIVKLNEYESIIRLGQEVAYNEIYNLVFKLDNRTLELDTKIIATKSIIAQKIFYYNLRFENLTEDERLQIRDYIAKQKNP